MKLEAVALVLSVAVAASGCSWNDFWSQFDRRNQGHPSTSTPGPAAPSAVNALAVQQFQGAIEHGQPPAVSLVSFTRGDRQERGVRAELGASQAVNLSSADPQEIENELRDGTLSLLDLFLIARAIKAAGYQLHAAEPGATDAQVARDVHDLLLEIVRTHTADCHALCEGDAAACGGRRSFGDGVPCEILGQTQDKISAHFGPAWCASGFCPAMSAAKE